MATKRKFIPFSTTLFTLRVNYYFSPRSFLRHTKKSKLNKLSQLCFLPPWSIEASRATKGIVSREAQAIDFHEPIYTRLTRESLINENDDEDDDVVVVVLVGREREATFL